MSKAIEDSFTDWESHVFGRGYGNGEAHVLPALRRFLDLCRNGASAHAYDYSALEAALSPAVAWLLINALCKADIIEYGTSPRFGWLTKEGEALRAFMLSKSEDELYDLATRCSGDETPYFHCYPDFCNCETTAEAERESGCQNPFWETVGALRARHSRSSPNKETPQ